MKIRLRTAWGQYHCTQATSHRTLKTSRDALSGQHVYLSSGRWVSGNANPAEITLLGQSVILH